MKIISWLILLLVVSCPAVHADTIDYWHVFYNNRILEKFSSTSRDPSVTLQLGSIGPRDTLSVKYFKDTPCMKCPVNLLIQDDQKNTLRQFKSYGTGSSLAIPLKDLAEFKRKRAVNSFIFYYYEGDYKLRIFLFKLKIN